MCPPKQNKKAECNSAFFPKSYHELNLLMLWFFKEPFFVVVIKRYRLKAYDYRLKYIFILTCQGDEREKTRNTKRKTELQRTANKKGGEVSTFFAPNLTMNLTYLCYGKTKIDVLVPKRTKKTSKSIYYR